MPTYSDEYIEHWGQIFEQHNLYAYGIRFDCFLEVPNEILAAFASGTYYPLLIRQRDVQERMDMGMPQQPVVQRGARLVHLTHKRAEPKSYRTGSRMTPA